MKPGLQTLLIFLACALVMGLYNFLGKSKLDQKEGELRIELDRLNGSLTAMQARRAEMPLLIGQLPYWKNQLDVFRAAMPIQIQDEAFLAAVAQECSNNNVELLGVELSPGGPWLGKLSEDQRNELEGIGVDVNAAEAVKTASYTIRMNGDYGAILRSMEALKRHGRMYTVDEFAGPAAGGAGTIVQTIDQRQTPIMVSGRIYYGLPESTITPEYIADAVEKILVSPKAKGAMSQITRRAANVVRSVTRSRSSGSNKNISLAPKRTQDAAHAPDSSGWTIGQVAAK